MADNQAYWDDFYASIYGPTEAAPTVAKPSPQVAFKYGLAGDVPPISDMARIGSRNSLGSAPTRLAANVGTPSGAGVPKRQVFALGAGLSPQVNALGYRVTDPVVPAVGAIQKAAPAVRPMQPVQAQRGIARAPVPSWIASMAPKAAPAVSAAPHLTPAQAYAAANTRTAVQDDAGYRVNGRTGQSAGGGDRSLMA